MNNRARATTDERGYRVGGYEGLGFRPLPLMDFFWQAQLVETEQRTFWRKPQWELGKLRDLFPYNMRQLIYRLMGDHGGLNIVVFETPCHLIVRVLDPLKKYEGGEGWAVAEFRKDRSRPHPYQVTPCPNLVERHKLRMKDVEAAKRREKDEIRKHQRYYTLRYTRRRAIRERLEDHD